MTKHTFFGLSAFLLLACSGGDDFTASSTDGSGGSVVVDAAGSGGIGNEGGDENIPGDGGDAGVGGGENGPIVGGGGGIRGDGGGPSEGGEPGVGGQATGGQATGGAGTCVPKTCLTIGIEMTGWTQDSPLPPRPACGFMDDGCGNVIDCSGTCSPETTCGGEGIDPDSDNFFEGVPNVCGDICHDPWYKHPSQCDHWSTDSQKYKIYRCTDRFTHNEFRAFPGRQDCGAWSGDPNEIVSEEAEYRSWCCPIEN